MIPHSMSSSLMNDLRTCRAGRDWKRYEELCEKILKFLFVPPLEGPMAQLRGESGIKDLVMFIPYDAPAFWQGIHRDYNSSLVIVECKNLREPTQREHIFDFSKYLTATHGLFGFILCRRAQTNSALREAIRLLKEHKKLILCVDDAHVIKMIRLRKNGDKPERVLDLLRRDLLLSI